MKKTICLLGQNNGTANWEYRVGKALKYLSGPLEAKGITLTNTPTDGALAYRVTGTVTNGFSEFDKLRVVQKQPQIIADLEDHPFKTVDTWPVEVIDKHRALFGPAHKWLDYADLVTVTTGQLAKVVEYEVKDNRLFKPSPKWRVLPNLIDPKDFAPTEYREEKDGLVVLWYGSSSHYGDLVQLAEPVERILSEFPKVRFVFWGCTLPQELAKVAGKSQERVRFKSWVEHKHFHKELAKLRPDIGLCSLADNQFNEKKSPIKFFELTMAGTAVVASPMYSEHSDGCCLTAYDAYDWYAGMKKYIRDSTFRLSMASQAKEWVEYGCSWDSEYARRDWYQFFTELADAW